MHCFCFVIIFYFSFLTIILQAEQQSNGQLGLSMRVTWTLRLKRQAPPKCPEKSIALCVQKNIAASASGIKQHCEGYYEGKGTERVFHKSQHAAKVEKRNALASAQAAANPPLPMVPQTIVVQVTLFVFWTVF